MQPDNNHDEIPIAVENSIQASKPNRGARLIARFFTVVAAIALLGCIGLLVRVSIVHKPAFELPLYSSLSSPELQLLEHIALLVWMAGMLTLYIAIIPHSFNIKLSRI